MATVDEKIDNAVHAAMNQLGLSVALHPDIADGLNAHIYLVVQGHITDDTEEE